MELLQGQIRDYAWGSRTAIAELQGRPVPSDGPEAELWLGAHPGAPALVDRDGNPVSLTDLLLAEPAHWLGERLVASDQVALSALTPLHYAPMLKAVTRVRLSTKHSWQMALDDLVLTG